MTVNYSNYSRRGSNWNNGGSYQNHGGRNSYGVEAKEVVEEETTIIDLNFSFVARLVILYSSAMTCLIKNFMGVNRTMLGTHQALQTIRDKTSPILLKLKKNRLLKKQPWKPCLPVLKGKVKTVGILTQEHRIT